MALLAQGHMAVTAVMQQRWDCPKGQFTHSLGQEVVCQFTLWGDDSSQVLRAAQ